MISGMRTGELAAHAGVNIQTVRFYERRGILPKPERTSSGYRVYSPEAVRLIRFIKRAQELGFTLVEIEDLLRLRHNRRSSCAAVKSAGQAKMSSVEAKIASLKAMKRALAVLLASCERNDRDRECPILEALESPDEQPAKVGP
jgi:Hg(II)-responsive transcriptional regulator